MNDKTTLTADEREFLRLAHVPGMQGRLKNMLETGEGMSEEIKNSPDREEIMNALSDLLALMEENGIGA